ncbi:MAG: hypothetical protein FWE04_02690 [Oscillospiraceae bacterium]|nr:hypothetical protein [Oscillospiraceae bacterium]
MKKTILALLAISALLFLAGCGNSHEEQSYTDNVDGFIPDILAFHAEVLEFDPNYYLQNEEALLFVRSITPVGPHEVGGRYFISRNDSVELLNAIGEPMSISDIPPGTIVDITYHERVLQSKPAIIPNAILVQIVE